MYYSKIKKKNRSSEGYIKFNEPKLSSITERNEQEIKNMSNTEENDVVKPSANFSIAVLEEYDIFEKAIDYIQVKHVLEKPKKKKAALRRNLKKS